MLFFCLKYQIAIDLFICRGNDDDDDGTFHIVSSNRNTSPYAMQQVSWIRRRDFQLLTVGLSTYSSDDRFLVEHARHMGHWSLRIKAVRDEDKGLYECQLSIHPTQSIYIELKVVGTYHLLLLLLLVLIEPDSVGIIVVLYRKSTINRL